ncbi:MAG TPA: iron-sulfur cluster carrier protein ApbC [Thermomicrobiales bacterium]|nr:iron-sulfur cluster carrier protein ApbC [Thermomicrobiales bacterium]
MSITTEGQTTLTKEQIIEAIRPVNDPEIGRGLVELGMIPNVEIDGRNVTVHVELTTPACPLRGKIADDIREALATIPEIGDVNFKWSSRVRPSGGGRSDAEPIKGVKNTIAVASGKGGVGKSTVAVNVAAALAKAGASVGLLDADVYGPSIPLMMGTHDKPMMRNQRIVPLEAHGVKLMSIGFILDPEKALIWRGPLVAQLITQFLNDVDWGELDYLVIDLPPGTGDVQLTLVQKIPISGAVIVTTPQEVALADAVKGLKMFQEVKTPILGIVENMSGFVCPSCNEVHDIFGTGGGKRTAEQYDVELLGQIPLEPSVRAGGDEGTPVIVSHPDSATGKAFEHAAERIAGRLSVEAAKKPRKPTIMLRTVR